MSNDANKVSNSMLPRSDASGSTKGRFSKMIDLIIGFAILTGSLLSPTPYQLTPAPGPTPAPQPGSLD